jgi:dihydroorotate dehydrogenase
MYIQLTMPTLSTTINGLKLPNPIVIASGPPGTNANVIGKALDEGWGAVSRKTVSPRRFKGHQRPAAVWPAAHGRL